MKKLLILITAVSIHWSALTQQEQCNLKVKVHNIQDVKGSLKLAIYDREDHFLKDAVTWGDTLIIDNIASFTFYDLKEGTYAVSIFHDENDNGKLDANFIGIPSEPYAFSNNAKGKFGPPSFEDCQIEVKRGEKEITIKL